MKKAIVVLAAVLVVVSFFPRPASAGVDFDLGLKGGMAFTNLRFSDMEGDLYQTLGKPVFGAFFAFNLTPCLAIQPEVYYLTLGAKMVKPGEMDYRMELAFNYIHVPVLVKVRLVKQGQIKPILFAGPYVSFLGRAKQNLYIDGVLEDSMDVKEYLKSTDFGAAFGGGLEFALSKLMLILDVRYNLGLTDINREGEVGTIKTKGLLVMAGIGF